MKPTEERADVLARMERWGRTRLSSSGESAAAQAVDDGAPFR